MVWRGVGAIGWKGVGAIGWDEQRGTRSEERGTRNEADRRGSPHIPSQATSVAARCATGSWWVAQRGAGQRPGGQQRRSLRSSLLPAPPCSSSLLLAPPRPPPFLPHYYSILAPSGHSGAFHVWDEVAGAGEAAFTYVPRKPACCCGHMAPVVDSSWWVFRELDDEPTSRRHVRLAHSRRPTFSPLLQVTGRQRAVHGERGPNVPAVGAVVRRTRTWHVARDRTATGTRSRLYLRHVCVQRRIRQRQRREGPTGTSWKGGTAAVEAPVKLAKLVSTEPATNPRMRLVSSPAISDADAKAMIVETAAHARPIV